MSNDIATLGIKVDATQVSASTTALDRFAAAAKPAAAATNSLERWPQDKIGGPLDPGPINWARWHIKYPRPNQQTGLRLVGDLKR